MLNLQSQVNAFYSLGDDFVCSPVLFERLFVAQFLFQNKEIHRTVATPVYINDLGIRCFQDPKLFYEEHCQLANFEQLTSDDIIQDIINCTPKNLGNFLDGVLLLTGNYNACKVALDTFNDSFLACLDYKTMSYVYMIYAALNDNRAEKIFADLLSIAPNTFEFYITCHRHAAFLTKRKNDYERSHKILEKGLEGIEKSDNQLATILMLNLQALNDLHTEGIETAKLK